MEKQIPEITGTLFIVLFIHSFFFYFLFSIFFTYSYHCLKLNQILFYSGTSLSLYAL